MKSPASTTLTRQHWRHFALHIVSPAVLAIGLFLALIFAIVLPAMKRNVIERKKEMIRELTQAAWSELASLHAQEQRGALTRAAAQQAAMARIKTLRYGDDGKDYFWISDFSTRMVMHPYRPELDGQDLTSYTDPGGKRLFVEYTKIVQTQGDGYVDYLWQWKDDDRRIVPKLSYVKGFAPWNWIIGTGIYLEDVRTEIRQITDRVVQVSLGISAIIAGLLAYLAKQGLNLERQRWRAETALRESEEKHRLLVEGASEGILLVLQGHPVHANRVLLDRLGCTAEELPDLPLEKILAPLPQGGGVTPGTERRARLFNRQGASATVLITSAPVTIGDKQGQIYSVRDPAARQQSEATLARLVADMQQLLPLASRAIKASKLAFATCGLDTPAQQAAAIMARAQCSAVLVLTPAGEPAGIVTDQDLRNRVLASSLPAAVPVARIMSAPLVYIADRALLFEAGRIMQERAVRHLVVTDERGRAYGILTTTEILHAQRHAMGALLNEIAQAPSPEAVRDARAKLPAFIAALLESGARVESVTRIMTAVSDAVLARLITLAVAELGAPPAAFAFVALGSEAREEQTLATDQDNAIIFADGPDDQAAAARAWFLRLGEKVCGWLDLAGYRRCPGGVMAANPKWCQPLAQWRSYFADCVRAARPQDLLDVNVFFDFRCAHGDADLVRRLREHLRECLQGDRRHEFFFHLAQSTLQFKAPRGFFGNLQLESAADHPPAFNIKAAIIPIVNFARMYALRHGFAETNTFERLRRLRDQGLLLPASHDELAQACNALMLMRLTHQAAQCGRGEPPDNLIAPAELTDLERSMLKKIFADIAVFQARLETDFARTA